MTRRKQIHHRIIDGQGFLREDGLWDIEGRLTDQKGYGFYNHDRGLIPKGEPLHHMRVILTLEDDYTIVDAKAITEYAPYRICPLVTDAYQKLIGLQIVPGFQREVKKRLSGVSGCTHLTEIVRILATVAWQTISTENKQVLWDLPEGESLANTNSPLPESLRNTCHAFHDNSEVSARVFSKTLPQNGKQSDPV